MWATSHFRSYLFGNSFTLVTDHEPLRWIMTTQKLTGKLARWSLLLQQYDFTVEHRAGTANTNADCLSRYPFPSAANAPVLDWTKGEVLAPATYLAMMVGAAPSTDAVDEERDIWDEAEVLHFILTHKYHDGLSVKTRDRIYRRAKSYRWMGDGVMRLLTGRAIVVVPRLADRQEIVVSTHQGMGHFGVQRVLDRLRKNY